MDARTGPEGRPRESSVGWRWALPESRLSRGQCHKSPDICPAALPPTGQAEKDATSHLPGGLSFESSEGTKIQVHVSQQPCH